MISQRQQHDQEFIDQRCKRLELAIDEIHGALEKALNATHSSADPRSLARHETYSLLKRSISKAQLDTLVTSASEQNNAKEAESAIESYFDSFQSRLLPNYYQDANETAAGTLKKEVADPNFLTDDDKSFFEYIVNIFKAITIARLRYNQLLKALTTFTDNNTAASLETISSITNELQRLRAKIEAISQIEVEIAEHQQRKDAQYNDVTTALYGDANLDGQYVNAKDSYTQKFDTLQRAYQRVNERANELVRQHHELEDLRNRLEAQLKSFREGKEPGLQTLPALRANIDDCNAQLDTHNRRIANLRDNKARLTANSNALFQDIEQLISNYRKTMQLLNRKIHEKNYNIKLYTSQLNDLIKKIHAAIKTAIGTNKLNGECLLPLQALVAVDHSQPKAKCDRLKDQGILSKIYETSSNRAWRELSEALSSSLSDIAVSHKLSCLEPFHTPVGATRKEIAATKAALLTFMPDTSPRDASAEAQQIVDGHKETIALQRKQIEDRMRELSPFNSIFPPEVVRTPASRQPVKQPNFFKRHWKKMLAGAGIGLVIGAVAVASIFTFGGAAAVFGGIATAVGVGAAIGGIAGTGLGVGTGAAVGGIRDWRSRYSNDNYRVDLHEDNDDTQEHRAPAEASSTTAALSDNNWDAFAPRGHAVARGGPNTNPFTGVRRVPAAATTSHSRKPKASVWQSSSDAGLFARRFGHTQLLHTDTKITRELSIIIKWLEDQPQHQAARDQLVKLNRVLADGYDVGSKESLAEQFFAQREAYRRAHPQRKQAYGGVVA